MNKTAIKNFAVWARNKLIADIQYQAGLMGITADGIKPALLQSTRETEFYDIGTAEPFAITDEAIRQRRSLADLIRQKADVTDYRTAYKYVIESVAYTWFNRLIAVRFMEINDYLPSHIRVLSSDSGKTEPDIVTMPFDADFSFTEEEKQKINRLKNENLLDEVFRMLFIRQCNALHEILPVLFERTADYTELLLRISVIDKEGVVWHLVHDIPEDDFNVEKGGQVEIIGWLYQYYNTEPKNEAFAKKGKITKEEIPAVTQLFTPDWIVRYMVENSLGRLWVEGHPNDLLKSRWKYYLEEAKQELKVQEKLDAIHMEYAKLAPEDIHFIDPCMGSGHILVYAFDVLMQIYESAGYSQRDAAKSILEHNLYGLDIDRRAYQLAYFAVMMKARQYNRRILSAETGCHVYSIQESNPINRNQLAYFGAGLSEEEKNDALDQTNGLLDTFRDAKEYGSILHVENYNWDLLRRFVNDVNVDGQMTLDAVGLTETEERLLALIEVGETMARKYEVVVTNPPYMGISNGGAKLNEYVKKNYPNSKSDLFAVFMERCREMTLKSGYQAMITQHAWMFLSGFEKLRVKLLQTVDIVNMVHLGARAFEEIGGEVVQTTSFVIRNSRMEDYTGTYCRLVEPNTQQGKEELFLAGENHHVARQDNFDKIPGSPVAYWVSDQLANSFLVGQTIDSIGASRSGMQTGNNDLFLRLWFEVCFLKINFNALPEEKEPANKWFPQPKGGSYRKWYGNLEYVVNFENNGDALKNYQGASIIKNPQYYFREGVSWSHTTSKAFSGRYMPQGCIFNVEAPTFYLNKRENLLYILGMVNTKVLDKLFGVISQTMHFMAGDMSRIPIIKTTETAIKNRVENVVKDNILLSRFDWDSFETSWDFKRHPLLPPIGKMAAEEENGKGEIPLQNETVPQERDSSVTVLSKDYTKEETAFAIFCIENVAQHLGVDAAAVYNAFAKDSDILEGYIIPCYDVLHTQGKDYVVNDLVELMKEKGVAL